MTSLPPWLTPAEKGAEEAPPWQTPIEPEPSILDKLKHANDVVGGAVGNYHLGALKGYGKLAVDALKTSPVMLPSTMGPMLTRALQKQLPDSPLMSKIADTMDESTKSTNEFFDRLETPLKAEGGAQKTGYFLAKAAPSAVLAATTGGASLPLQSALQAVTAAGTSDSKTLEGKGIDTAAGAAGPVVGSGLSFILRQTGNLAVKAYMSALGPTTRKLTNTANQIVPDLLEQNVAGGIKGLAEKGATNAKLAGQGIDDAYSAATKAGKTIDATQLADALEAAKKPFLSTNTQTGAPIQMHELALKRIQELQDKIREFGTQASPSQLWDFRKILDRVVRKSNGFMDPIDPETLASISKQARGILQDSLTAVDPNVIKPLNAQYKLWKGLSDVASASAARPTGAMDFVRRAIKEGIGTGLGAATIGGPVGAAVGAAVPFVASRPIVKTAAAVALNKLSSPAAQETSRLLSILGLAPAAAEGTKALAGVEEPPVVAVPPSGDIVERSQTPLKVESPTPTGNLNNNPNYNFDEDEGVVGAGALEGTKESLSALEQIFSGLGRTVARAEGLPIPADATLGSMLKHVEDPTGSLAEQVIASAVPGAGVVQSLPPEAQAYARGVVERGTDMAINPATALAGGPTWLVPIFLGLMAKGLYDQAGQLVQGYQTLKEMPEGSEKAQFEEQLKEKMGGASVDAAMLALPAVLHRGGGEPPRPPGSINLPPGPGGVPSAGTINEPSLRTVTMPDRLRSFVEGIVRPPAAVPPPSTQPISSALINPEVQQPKGEVSAAQISPEAAPVPVTGAIPPEVSPPGMPAQLKAFIHSILTKGTREPNLGPIDKPSTSAPESVKIEPGFEGGEEFGKDTVNAAKQIIELGKSKGVEPATLDYGAVHHIDPVSGTHAIQYGNAGALLDKNGVVTALGTSSRGALSGGDVVRVLAGIAEVDGKMPPLDTMSADSLKLVQGLADDLKIPIEEFKGLTIENIPPESRLGRALSILEKRDSRGQSDSTAVSDGGNQATSPGETGADNSGGVSGTSAAPSPDTSTSGPAIASLSPSEAPAAIEPGAGVSAALSKPEAPSSPDLKAISDQAKAAYKGDPNATARVGGQQRHVGDILDDGRVVTDIDAETGIPTLRKAKAAGTRSKGEGLTRYGVRSVAGGPKPGGSPALEAERAGGAQKLASPELEAQRSRPFPVDQTGNGTLDLLHAPKEQVSSAPTRKISVDKLVGTEEGDLHLNTLQYHTENPGSKGLGPTENWPTDRPVVAEKDGKYYILDGRHRLAAQISNGAKEVDVAVLNAPQEIAGQTRYGTSPNKLGYYSQAERVLSDPKTQNSNTGETWPGFLKNKGVKPDELKWAGLDDLFAANKGKKVTKQQILDHLAANDVQVEQVTLGGKSRPSLESSEISSEIQKLKSAGYTVEVNPHDSDYLVFGDKEGPLTADGFDTVLEIPKGPLRESANQINEFWSKKVGETYEPFFSDYQEPGGTNYREVLLKLPVRGGEDRSLGIDWDNGVYKIINNDTKEYLPGTYKTREAADLAREQEYVKDQGRNFTQGHYDEPNILAHVRLNDRISPDGKKTLFVEELQGDWPQKLRQAGIKQAKAEGLKEDTPEFSKRVNELVQKGFPEKGLPVGPYVQKTEGWTDLAVKRILRMAAEEGYDRVAWTTGETQTNRYSEALQKQVDYLTWDKTPEGIQLRGMKNGQLVVNTVKKENAISDAIGKSMGDQIIQSKEKSGEFRGKDIKVSDVGMAGYYDKIVPKAFERVGGKFGAKVGETEIANPEMRGRSAGKKFTYEMSTKIDSDGAAEYWIKNSQTGEKIGPFPDADARQIEFNRLEFGGTKAHSIDITPQMRESVMKEGFSKFGVKPNELGFYSQLDRVVGDPKVQTVQKAGDWLRFLQDPKRQVKAAEMRWSGLKQFLEDSGESKVSKEEIQKFLSENQVNLKEEKAGTKFAAYQEPGGRKYRELTLSVPDFKPEFTQGHYPEPNVIVHYRVNDRTVDGKKILFLEEVQGDWPQKAKKYGFDKPVDQNSPSVRESYQRLQTAEEAFSNYRRQLEDKYSDEQKTNFPTNYGVFLRQAKEANLLNPEGRALYAVNRSQNAGFSLSRDPEGAMRVMRGAKPETAQKWLDHWNNGGSIKNFGRQRGVTRERLLSLSERMNTEEADRLKTLLTEIRLRRGEHGARNVRNKGIPEGPYVSKTEDWTGLALKRILMMAAEGNYDGVAWTPGEVQVDRWQGALRKAVDKIDWKKTEKGIQLSGYKNGIKVVDTTERDTVLSDAIGKAMADKIIDDPEISGTIEGSGIKISDTGMAGYYNHIVPQVFEKLGQEWGTKVKSLSVDLGTKGKLQAPSIDITPEMRESIPTKGFSQFGAKPGEGADPFAHLLIDLDKIKANLPTELARRVVQDKSGDFVIKTSRGEIRIKPTADVGMSWDALEAGHGSDTVEAVKAGARHVTGSTTKIGRDSIIKIVDEGILPHEIGHPFLDHFATDKEWRVIRQSLAQTAEKEGRDISETFSDGFKDWFDHDRASRATDTPIQAIYRRIHEFFSGIRRLFKTNVEDIYKDLGEGKVFDRSVTRNEASIESLPAKSEILGLDRPQVAYASPENVQITPPERIANFKKWFGDSKITDAGEPKVVYHRGSFDETQNGIPDIGENGMHFGSKQAADERPIGKAVDDAIKGLTVEKDPSNGRWYWATEDGLSSYDVQDERGFPSKQAARAAGELFAQTQDEGFEWDDSSHPLTAAYLNIQNPKRVVDQETNWATIIKKAKAEGYDGLVYTNKFEDKGSTSYVAFDPKQIKSAVGNSGTFSRETPDIRYGLDKAEKEAIYHWGDDKHRAIRDSLADNTPTDRAKVFQTAVDKLPRYSGGSVYRGLGYFPKELESKWGVSLKEGNIFSIKKFSSWSSERDNALDFTDSGLTGDPRTLLVYSPNDTGTKFTDINRFIPKDNQWGKEVLSSPGKFRIKSIKQETIHYKTPNPMIYQSKDAQPEDIKVWVIQLEDAE